MSNELTETQETILRHAHEHTEGKIVWFPEHIKGGARQKVLDGLFNRALITQVGDGWFVAAEGYDAINVPRKAAINSEDLSDIVERATAKPSRMRDNSKQAQVIELLRRPEGATINQICEATGWKQHTVRGTFAGAFKKKLGLQITSTKEPGGHRVYRVS